MLKIFLFLLPAMAAFIAGLCLDAAPSRAAGGDAPWCIIDSEGNLHCWYANSQACLQQIAGGSRGFCVQNPSGGSAAAAPAQAPQPARRKKR